MKLKLCIILLAFIIARSSEAFTEDLKVKNDASKVKSDAKNTSLESDKRLEHKHKDKDTKNNKSEL